MKTEREKIIEYVNDRCNFLQRRLENLLVYVKHEEEYSREFIAGQIEFLLEELN